MLQDFDLRPGRQWMSHFLKDPDRLGHADEEATPTSDKEEEEETPLWRVRHVFPPPRGGQFVDAFRALHPLRERAFTCWRAATNARANNYGTRLDYALVSRGGGLFDAVRQCEIHPEVGASTSVKTNILDCLRPFITSTL